MNYLLDTHTFLWTVASSDKLPKNVQKTITNSNNEIFVSAVSFWEIAIKYRLGKLDLGGLNPNEFLRIAEEMEFQTINLSAEESSSYFQLKEEQHKDPFDRMLVWQAIQRNLTIISKDRKLELFIEFGLTIYW
jgi:PIN domain nuclease of toxin-antitoxin system